MVSSRSVYSKLNTPLTASQAGIPHYEKEGVTVALQHYNIFVSGGGAVGIGIAFLLGALWLGGRWLASRRHRRQGLLRDGACSFGQPRFPKTLNKQLYVFGAPGDMRRYCKGGIDLKHTRRRVVRLSVTSEMGEGGREAAVSCHIELLTKGFLPYDDRLVKATKLNKGGPNASRRHV